MTEISIEHDARSPWVWDRAALAAACSELGVTGRVKLRQVYGLYRGDVDGERGNMGSSTLETGGHLVEVDAQLDPGEMASGVTWHELGHVADLQRFCKAGRLREYGVINALCDSFGIYADHPMEIEARAVAEQHQGESLTLTVRNLPSYEPRGTPVWRAVMSRPEAPMRLRRRA